ncbi:MAG TPA: hypothetical protein VML75_03490 [Kofleriaceae bacterium]|nr:hypothetical protein [Kofleriaceae bacterium]
MPFGPIELRVGGGHETGLAASGNRLALAGNPSPGREFAARATAARWYHRRDDVGTRIAHLVRIAAALAVVTSPALAIADDGDAASTEQIEPSPRRQDATWREIYRGPFQTSRLFAMPTAEVVGAFQISLSGDASLLTEANTLSTSNVLAIGFGDIAQLEYRNAVAVTTSAPDLASDLEGAPFALPTVGVQLKAPYRAPRFVPSTAIALRFGLPHDEQVGALTHTERATDLYVVGSMRLGGPFERFTLHGGLRVSAASIETEGDPMVEDHEETLFLPAGGWEVQMTEDTVLAGELALVPVFEPGTATEPSDIRSGVFGRAGIRWRLLPSFVLDASVGYRIEIARLGSSPSSMASSLVDWDIRLGGEVFVPWGAAACKTIHLFCE